MVALHRWLSIITKNRTRILLYHSISRTSEDPFAVMPDQFERQMEFLASSGYCVLSLEEACRLMRVHHPLHKTVVLTFDDGYTDFLENAAPVLQRQHFPATLFVVTGRVGAISDWNRHCTSRKTLTWQELEQVRSMGFTLGSHTVSHARLPNLNRNAMDFELGESFRTLQEIMGIGFVAFSYPFGDFTTREKVAVAQVGYQCALASGRLWGNGSETDRYMLSRELVHRRTQLSDFVLMVQGKYDWRHVWYDRSKFLQHHLDFRKISGEEAQPPMDGR